MREMQRLTTRTSKWIGRTLAIVTIAIVACDDGPSEPQTPENDEIARLTFFGMDPAALSALPLQAGPMNLEHPCPAGGKLRRDGTHAVERVGNTLVATWNFTLTHSDCAFDGPFGRLVTNGSTHNEGHARTNATAQPGERPAILEYSAHQVGTMSTTHNGVTRTCSTDITQTYDVQAQSIRLTGTVCGAAIDILLPRG
ncbi:MAG: hypothetical protein ACREMQ_15770 [Longimicrobiales bacterium]